MPYDVRGAKWFRGHCNGAEPASYHSEREARVWVFPSRAKGHKQLHPRLAKVEKLRRARVQNKGEGVEGPAKLAGNPPKETVVVFKGVVVNALIDRLRRGEVVLGMSEVHEGVVEIVACQVKVLLPSVVFQYKQSSEMRGRCMCF